MLKRKLLLCVTGLMAASTIAHAAGTTAEASEGETVVRNILGHDKTIVTAWSTRAAPGTVTVLIYGVTDSTKQNTIISWVKALRQHRQISLPVNLRFYQRLNLPKEADGSFSWRHGPERLVRSDRI